MGSKSITLSQKLLCRSLRYLRCTSWLFGETPNMISIFLNLVLYSFTLFNLLCLNLCKWIHWSYTYQIGYNYNFMRVLLQGENLLEFFLRKLPKKSIPSLFITNIVSEGGKQEVFVRGFYHCVLKVHTHRYTHKQYITCS
jgi:hypothetical protein